MFRFVERERASYPVTTLCRVLGVSTSGSWAHRPPKRVRVRLAGEHMIENQHAVLCATVQFDYLPRHHE